MEGSRTTGAGSSRFASRAAWEQSIRTLAEISQLTQSPYAIAILGITRQIIESISRVKKYDEDLERLATRVLEIAMPCIGAFQGNTRKASEAALFGGELLGALENIAREVTKLSNKPRLLKLLSTTTGSGNLKQAEQELEHVVLVFCLRMQLANVSLISPDSLKTTETAFEAAIARTRQEQLKMLKEKTLETMRDKAKASSFTQNLPPAPQIFHGREDLITSLIDRLTSKTPSYVAILGSGGIGKTSLALTAVHHPFVSSLFGVHRYFLSCESILNAKDLSAAISQIFGINEGNVAAELTKIANRIDSNILLVLDNFETTWEPHATKEDVEKLLSQLSAIPSISLLITLRGAERPLGVPWTRPFIPALSTLDITSARQVFLDMADISEQDPHLDELLTEVDFMPLAVTLLANQAQSMECSTLLKIWRQEKTAAISRDKGMKTRLSSLDVSIRLSLNSERVQRCSEALHLLQILSFLPDGILFEDISKLTPEGMRFDDALSALTRSALAHWDSTKRLKLHATIREYIRRYHPINDDDFIHLFSYHATLARQSREKFYAKERPQVRDRLLPQVANIHAVIRHALEQTGLEARAITAAVDMGYFHRMSYVGSIMVLLTEAVEVARKIGAPVLEADALISLTTFGAPSHFLWEANFASAIKLYEEAGEEAKAADVKLKNAYARRHQGSDLEVRKRLEDALALLPESASAIMKAQAYYLLAMLMFWQGDIRYCLASAKKGLNFISTEEYPVLAGQLHHPIVMAYNSLGLFSATIKVGRRGLNLMASESNYLETDVAVPVGLALLIRGKLADARQLFEHYLEVATLHDRNHHIVELRWCLGKINIIKDELEDALICFHMSLNECLYPISAAVMLISIGEVEMRRGHLESARAHCLEAIKVYPRINGCIRQEEAVLHFVLGDVAHYEESTDPWESMQHYIVGGLIGRKLKSPVAVALCVQRLGDVFTKMEENSTTGCGCYKAALQIVEPLGAVVHTADNLVRLGVASMRARKADALEYLTKARDTFRRAGGTIGAQFCENWLNELKDTSTEPDLSDPIDLPKATLEC